MSKGETRRLCDADAQILIAQPGSAPLPRAAMARLEAARELLRQMLLTDAQPAVRKAAIAAGVLVVLGASEAYSGSVTRTLRSIRRHAESNSVHAARATKPTLLKRPSHEPLHE